VRQVGLAAILPSLACAAAGAAEMVLVDQGVSRAPIVVAEGAAPATARAAAELAAYLEKISGARPKVVVGNPDPTPASAVWVGQHPKLAGVFPNLKSDLQHPEEILLACNGTHLVIAGRDRMVGETQTEHGTANAVYTFLQKRLGVRWLWPGPLGEDLVRRDRITVAPFEYRFHPLFRHRGVYLRLDRASAPLQEWARFQRIGLDSLKVPAGHAFSDWWDKYHQERPDYFALQPDGTRSGYPGPATAKLCETNPRVWAQWLANAGESLQNNPTLSVLNAAENDGSSSGWCVCEKCRAWDHPDGTPYDLNWEGKQETYVATTDRNVKFWNMLARGLRERFGDHDVFVGGLAYGPSRTAPVAATLEKNTLISFVGHFPLAGDAWREQEKTWWKAWAEKAPNLVYRPNLFWYSGGMSGLPSVALRNTLEDFRFLAEHRCVGLVIDTTPQHWATQGPQYYAMAQLAWDPLQDGRALLNDYYRRAFGNAAGEIEKYFDLMEEAHKSLTERPGFRHSMGLRYQVLGACLELYNSDLLGKAGELLRQADAKAAAGPDIHRQRVAFIRTGLDFIKLQLEIIRVMAQVRQSKGQDAESVRKAVELCRTRDELLRREENRFAVSGTMLNSYIKNRTMEDYLGPPSAAFREAAGVR